MPRGVLLVFDRWHRLMHGILRGLERPPRTRPVALYHESYCGKKRLLESVRLRTIS